MRRINIIHDLSLSKMTAFEIDMKIFEKKSNTAENAKGAKIAK